MKFQHTTKTADGQPRGCIKPMGREGFRELWFHTGTKCNLSCPSCLEGSSPTNDRLEFLTQTDVQLYLNESRQFPNLERICFTGGEPFLNPHFMGILDAAMKEGEPVMVLTNATQPLERKFDELVALQKTYVEKYGRDNLLLRVSLDSYNKDDHDDERGKGTFQRTLGAMKQLQGAGIQIALAGRILNDAKFTPGLVAVKKTNYRQLLRDNGISDDIDILIFPRLEDPYSHLSDHPVIEAKEPTAECLANYAKDKQHEWMCNYLKFVIKPNGGEARVYACTIVDDDEAFDHGRSLVEAVEQQTYMKHPRCYTMCFKGNASCSGGVRHGAD